MIPSGFPSLGRPLGRPPIGPERLGLSHCDRERAEPAFDTLHPCPAQDLLQPPPPSEPVASRVPLDAPDPASHVDAALILLRRRTGVPLAERLASGLPSDRAAAVALLDGLMAEGEPAGPLASSGRLAASEQGRSAIAQAAALRDRLTSAAPADAGTLQHAVDELVSTLEAIPCGREHARLRERANTALRAIVGGPPWDLVAMINSDRLPDRRAAAAQIDTLLGHLRVLASRRTEASDVDVFPPTLRAAVHRLVLEGGHGLSPAQRTALRQCPVFGPELEAVLLAGGSLSSAATNVVDRLCRQASRCTADASGHAGDAVLLAELAALGASASKLAKSARPLLGDAVRAAADSRWHGSGSSQQTLLHDALATRLSTMKPDDMANLRRWLTTPTMLALRTMVHRSARAGERHDVSTSRAASALAAQRRLLGDWLAGYDELAALLALRMPVQAEPAARRKTGKETARPGGTPAPGAREGKARAAGKAPVTDQGAVNAGRADFTSVDKAHGASPAAERSAAITAATNLFRQLFATDPAPETPPESLLDWVKA
ncbi:hypothetical protein EM868_17570 [Cupriavidus gilardii]|uniref:hypothetical protein n=1 Tax=Cupriavidus gilardii TaxID=82541 RepID=UPI001EE601DB|nr:hypothetical protein [Cupriavidus gilardii]MCG5262738.1 hypothetical protein [Cupriavidus gilardii]MDF9431589.1 hypothetical protein [Cupriavidus gilardii]